MEKLQPMQYSRDLERLQILIKPAGQVQNHYQLGAYLCRNILRF